MLTCRYILLLHTFRLLLVVIGLKYIIVYLVA